MNPQRVIEQPTRPERRRWSGCAICAAPVPGRHLMCAQHWHLVPKRLQVDVVATWLRFERPRGVPDRSQLLGNYRRARDAAIAAVRAELEHPTPAEQAARSITTTTGDSE